MFAKLWKSRCSHTLKGKIHLCIVFLIGNTKKGNLRKTWLTLDGGLKGYSPVWRRDGSRRQAAAHTVSPFDKQQEMNACGPPSSYLFPFHSGTPAHGMMLCTFLNQLRKHLHRHIQTQHPPRHLEDCLLGESTSNQGNNEDWPSWKGAVSERQHETC